MQEQEKRNAWTIDGVHMDFKSLVTYDEAKEVADVIRNMYPKKENPDASN